MEKRNVGYDVQGGVPQTQLSLSRVGITGLKRILRLNRNAGDGGHNTLFFAEMDLFAHLDAKQAGVHMSRFIENMEDIASEMATESSPTMESMAERMALAVARTQGAKRSEVRIRAQYPMVKSAPVSGMEVEDLYTFIGIAISNGRETRRAIGVEVNGLTVCPCAREMISGRSRQILQDSGCTQEQAEHIVSLLPLASHNQRGRGTLILGTEHDMRAEQLVHIVESSMSAEIYELLKRPDELYVVEKGHMKPRFVEDVVREIVRNTVDALPDLPDATFLMARQENFESIHTHNAYAERSGLLGDMRAELSKRAAGGSGVRFPSVEAWLESLL